MAQTVERSRRAETAETPADTPPARGLSRTFDSLEATQRLVALSDAARQDDPIAHTLPLSMQTSTTDLNGGWRARDTLVVAAAALSGLIAAVLIVLL